MCRFQCGKTTVANFLSDATENLGGDYHPTQGVRILEFEVQSLNVNNKHVKAEIELWDCSGDHKFETCWPAFQRDTQGVVFVYNPIVADHARELELLYNYYVTQTDLTSKHSLVLAVSKSEKDGKPAAKLSSTFSRVMQVATNVEENGNRLRVEFNNFLVNVLGGLRDRNEQEELNIINTQPPSL
ncbi:Intraflagellar transport protein 22 [Gryllus bimaculatus]|nr:Intraflagellar transport protein 22 [Gryllus bimaculatus]